MSTTHVKLRTPKGIETILATVTQPYTPQAGDCVEGLEMGYATKKVRGIVEEVIEEVEA